MSFEGLEVWFSTQKQIWQIIETPYGSHFNLRVKINIQTVTLFLAIATLS